MGVGSKIRELIDYYYSKKNEKNIVPIDIPKNQNNLLENKVALIVGGTGGIGAAIAEAFIEAGAKVIISGTKEEKVKNAVEKLGDCARGIQIDLNKVGGFDNKVSQAISLFPKNRIDILVNCAGVHGNQTFGSVSETTYDSVMNTNLKGMFFMTQVVSNYMKEKRIKGHILNVSSAAALKPGYTPYEISKSGVRSFTLGAAAELIPYGIIVNAIAPGPVATAMLGRKEGDTLYTDCIPAKRFATPSEIGQLAVIMVSDMCNLVIGDTFYVSGGSGTIKY
ncbi:SDR family oxidoreductase [Ruminococcus sp. 1001275B_160808_F8]|uniref:SDR family NAD(P)-dependent oxidoreductase n=1 Tax=Ruminococcus sp. 1001275B_160808_F8 TaxID=2787131 RepID=UPI0018A9A6E5|nr:SDR family oxidoreductase [Ruminococcus sp. 1001275B_160808_F8]